MEIIIAFIGVAVVAAIIYLNREAKQLDLNEDVVQEKKALDLNGDGKVNTQDVKVAVQKVAETVKQVADVNKDGKVDAKDVKAAAAAITTKAKSTVKKATTKKSTAKPKTAKTTNKGGRKS